MKGPEYRLDPDNRGLNLARYGPADTIGNRDEIAQNVLRYHGYPRYREQRVTVSPQILLAQLRARPTIAMRESPFTSTVLVRDVKSTRRPFADYLYEAIIATIVPLMLRRR